MYELSNLLNMSTHYNYVFTQFCTIVLFYLQHKNNNSYHTVIVISSYFLSFLLIVFFSLICWSSNCKPSFSAGLQYQQILLMLEKYTYLHLHYLTRPLLRVIVYICFSFRLS